MYIYKEFEFLSMFKCARDSFSPIAITPLGNTKHNKEIGIDQSDSTLGERAKYLEPIFAPPQISSLNQSLEIPVRTISSNL